MKLYKKFKEDNEIYFVYGFAFLIWFILMITLSIL